MIRHTVKALNGESIESRGEVRFSKARGVEFIDVPERFADVWQHGLLLGKRLIFPYHGAAFLDALVETYERSSSIFIGAAETIADPEEP